jgi:hypothetical protein
MEIKYENKILKELKKEKERKKQRWKFKTKSFLYL